jgi:hypothetical protein
MTQAQRTQTSANSLVPAAVAGLVMVAALTGAILVYGFPTMSLTHPTGTVTTNSALVRAENAWEAQRIQESAAFDVMNSANRASADQWEAVERVLTVAPAARSSTYTEAERHAILRHQLMTPEGGLITSQLDSARKLQIDRQVQSGVGWNTSLLDAARKLQIERQLQSGMGAREFTGQRKGSAVDPWSDDDVQTPTHPQLR